MRTAIAVISVLFLSHPSFCQSPTFAVASVKPSRRLVGRDANNRSISISPAGLSARNVTLKRLITEAYNLQPHQVSGGPNWLDSNEYDLDAKADVPAPKQQLLLMLRTLLTERFRLAFHRDTKELRVYELVADRGGPKIHPVKDADDSAATSAAGLRSFRGDMRQFANLLSVQLTIPAIDDPTRPSIASGAPIPVIDKTALPGIYDIALDVKPETAGDMFTFLQRVLPEQLGLKLESRKAQVEILIVDHAEKTPVAN